MNIYEICVLLVCKYIVLLASIVLNVSLTVMLNSVITLFKDMMERLLLNFDFWFSCALCSVHVFPLQGDNNFCFLDRRSSDLSLCLHFFSYVMVGDSSCSAELRKLIAQCVSNDPLTFNTAFLGQDNSDYCNWILNKDNWGGI